MKTPTTAPPDPILRRAALTSRWIGFASVACGGLLLYTPTARGQGFPEAAQLVRLHAVAGFIVPGLLYLALPTFLLRRRRWAILALLLLALLTLAMMGLFFFLHLFNFPASAWLCAICLTWAAAVAVLCANLGRALIWRGPGAKPPENAQKSAPLRR